jgi:tetratricopeptide (TPR) repeat protein
VFRSGKYKKHAIFGFLFFIISVSPVLQLIPFGKAMLAERYTYIPYIGLSFVPAMIIDSISRNNRMLFNKIRAISLIIITGFILIFSVQTFHRTGVWKNTEKLFYDVTKKYPDDATGFRVLGLACSQDGNFRSALVAYSKAIEISPSLPGTWYNRGLVKAELKDYYGAASDYSKCISLDPKNFRSYNNRANIKVKLKDYNGAMSDYNAAIIISPSFAEAFNNRGNLKALTGDLKNAFSDFEKAIELDPAYAQAYSNRGNVKAYFNDFEGAVQDYRKALGINPDDKKTIHNLEITQKKLETMPEN